MGLSRAADGSVVQFYNTSHLYTGTAPPLRIRVPPRRDQRLRPKSSPRVLSQGLGFQGHDAHVLALALATRELVPVAVGHLALLLEPLGLAFDVIRLRDRVEPHVPLNEREERVVDALRADIWIAHGRVSAEEVRVVPSLPHRVRRSPFLSFTPTRFASRTHSPCRRSFPHEIASPSGAR